MVAKVSLDWRYIEFAAADVQGWRSLKNSVDLEGHPDLFSDRAVYIIRVRRPFAFKYENGSSPVAYIGKGKAQQRLTSHLKSWIQHLSKSVPGLKIRIHYCEPKVRRLGTICEGVEADLIEMFIKKYGSRPLRNRNTPTHPNRRSYSSKDLTVLHLGKGKGYHWALTPLPSSHFYRAK